MNENENCNKAKIHTACANGEVTGLGGGTSAVFERENELGI